MKVELERTETRVAGAKRQNAPYQLRWACPVCGTEHEHDLDDGHYLSYPTFGEPYEHNLYCCHDGTPHEEEPAFEEDVILRADLVLTIERQPEIEG